MKKEILRRVQLEQLDILKEIHRVCVENDIKYFLDSGTLIGAVRHNGFIPWDDDIDIGMMRSEYERFEKIAPDALGEKYAWQSWKNDENYALPFGKVRKKNTVYIEEKSGTLDQCGFYVDVFPYDHAPNDDRKRKKLINKRVFIARCLLMKHNYSPWLKGSKTDHMKKVGYTIYRLFSIFTTHKRLVKKYENLVLRVPKSSIVYEQIGKKSTHYYKTDWLEDLDSAKFEDSSFFVPINTHERLKEEYGDYMKLPPEECRENRHSIQKIIFSDGEEFENV